MADTNGAPLPPEEEAMVDSDEHIPFSGNRTDEGAKSKNKVVVVMGATGAGKSRLAIDLASHLSGVEIVNADSMQVYRGLDVLTNKVPVPERNGVPHHLLGCIDPSVGFTSRDFRDLAIPIIDDVLLREGLPVVVGGTNYYIQALVSPFLADDLVEDVAACSRDEPRENCGIDKIASFERLKEVDPVAANRIHPNDHRKIKRYLDLYESSGVRPSNLFQGKNAEKRGRADTSRYNCCFIWVDVSLPILDRYVEQRVDSMLDSGLLNEVCGIYNQNTDYTQGLYQAIGVHEFGMFFKSYFSIKESTEVPWPYFSEIGDMNGDVLKKLLAEAIEKLKSNTCKLVRRQKRRLNQLKSVFGWNFHHVDATEAFTSNSGDLWQTTVVEPCAKIVRNFLEEPGSLTNNKKLGHFEQKGPVLRDLWTQYICEACGNQVLRGAHEWEQHKQGRRHRKRLFGLKKQFYITQQVRTVP
ncbi:tRNA dimethylallyltransferase 2-like isoform X1 [Zingiber officinale]|uniref:tRNA dimethylallyltransferase 2-like isoform X1 n=1 Tax=Zingiber officinale TaxID=94328 RepID=UPI001C4A9C18|nr:tRNA dimethylallyltransferase 2-like isoform X1 [Zingiber officinale]